MRYRLGLDLGTNAIGCVILRLNSAPRLFAIIASIAIALVWADLATAQDKGDSFDAGAYKFVSCKQANAFKEKYESLGVRFPESFYACDKQLDAMEELLSPYRNFDEAYKQYSKDSKSNPEAKLGDYKYPRPHILSNDELASIITISVLHLEPNVFTVIGSNGNAVFFLYRDATRWVGQDIVTAWYLQSYVRPQQLSMQFHYASLKVQVAINCSKGSYADLQQTAHRGHRADSDGQVLLGRVINEAKFLDIPPNTFYSMLQKKLCERPNSRERNTTR